MSKLLFGILLGAVGLLYIWLAAAAVLPGITSGDWVSYLGSILFLVALVGAGLAGVNLVRGKRG